MKKYIYILFIISVVLHSCVDDYEDANPPTLLDAPAGSLSTSDNKNEQGQIPLKGGEESTLTINIVDAPGVLDSIGFETSRGGEVVNHTFSSVEGSTTGSFQVTFKAPLNLNGVTTLTIDVFDAQKDEKGDPAAKRATFNQSFSVSYQYAEPDFAIDIPADPLFKGESKTLTVNIMSVPGGGLDTLIASVLEGEIEVDGNDLTNIMGKESGTVKMTYTAPDDKVGEFEVSVFITDKWQNRSNTVTDTVLVEYEYGAPEFELDFSEADTIKGNVPTIPTEAELPFKVNVIDVPSGISSIAGNVSNGTVEVTFDELVDKTSGIADAVFTAPAEEGFYVVEVVVTNNEGRSETKSQKVAVFNP